MAWGVDDGVVVGAGWASGEEAHCVFSSVGMDGLCGEMMCCVVLEFVTSLLRGCFSFLKNFFDLFF